METQTILRLKKANPDRPIYWLSWSLKILSFTAFILYLTP